MESLHVLLVDDNALDREQICMLFGELDAPLRVSTAATAAEGLDALKSGERFDCALLDFRLPDGNAFWILDELARSEAPLPPSYVISGASASRVEAESLRRGALSFLVKDDLTSDVLRSALERAVAAMPEETPLPDQLALDLARMDVVDPPKALRLALSELGDALEEAEALKIAQMPPVFASATILADVFGALIESCVRYQGGSELQIGVRAERYGQEVLFTVDDAGSAGSDGRELSLPARWIELHGGELWTELRAAGHRVRFTLPAADELPL